MGLIIPSGNATVQLAQGENAYVPQTSAVLIGGFTSAITNVPGADDITLFVDGAVVATDANAIAFALPILSTNDSFNVTIGRSGSVRSLDGSAVYINSAFGLVRNDGDVWGTVAGIALTGTGLISNTGTVYGGQFGLGMTGASIPGYVPGPEAFSFISNSGTVEGLLYGAYAIGSNGIPVVMTNSGLIKGLFGGVVMGNGNDRLTNTGRIEGETNLGGGNDVFDTMFGVMVGDVSGGNGSDTMIGMIDRADVMYGDAGADLMYGHGGNDTLAGGTAPDLLDGGSGDDVLRGEAGNDTLIGGAGNDALFGSTGDDRYVFEFNTSGRDTISEAGGNAAAVDRIEISDRGLLDVDFRRSGTSLVIEDEATGSRIVVQGHFDSAQPALRVEEIQFEGGMVKQLQSGLTGGALADIIIGTSGNNALVGGGGDDVLIGAGGRDTMTGGAGNDIFVWRSVADGGMGANRDIVTDFTKGADIIDLEEVGVSRFMAGGAAFRGIGVGEARSTQIGGVSVIQVDANGDGVADFEIGFNAVITFAATDFHFM